MSGKVCPRCDLTNPASAVRCDCGYDFATRSVKQSYLHPQGRNGGAPSQTPFCEDCLARSLPDAPGNIRTINGIGRTFYGEAERCRECGSVVRDLWFVIFFIPIVPLGRYRYQRLESAFGRSRFVARRVG